ncbi:MAG: hypothetical protein ACOX87_15655 [Chloroflexota bacterium]
MKLAVWKSASRAKFVKAQLGKIKSSTHFGTEYAYPHNKKEGSLLVRW